MSSGRRGPFDYDGPISLERLQTVCFLPVDPVVLNHDRERRDFVEVPMDYARPEGPKLNIFYRLMPADGLKVDNTSKPIIVVINGGPGLPSSRYRPYDYDYPTKAQRERNLLAVLLTKYRVLIMDQRGTPGNSAPLDMNDPQLDPRVVSRYFNAAHLAQDQQAVINKAIPMGEKFYMLCQSYAGMVGVCYLTLPEIQPQPHGLIFSSAILPHANPIKAAEARRRAQLKLNQQLRKMVPDIASRVQRLSEHFQAEGLRPTAYHYLWSLLGDGPGWEEKLKNKIEALSEAPRQKLEAFITAELLPPNLLNYIELSNENTPGYTDRVLARTLIEHIPFEPWMLDESQPVVELQFGVPWQDALLDELDACPPKPAVFPPLDQIRQAIARTQLLFTLGKDDAFIEVEAQRKIIWKFEVDGHTRIEFLPGGHMAIFRRRGVDVIEGWIRTLDEGSDAMSPGAGGQKRAHRVG